MGVAVQIRGAVQGVGFRPHVRRLAVSLGLTGFVRNDGRGVYIELEGSETDRFMQELRSRPPPLARIASVDVSAIPPRGFTSFVIAGSDPSGARTAPMPQDAATCPACIKELFDPADRRFRYPFINCVHCGPRWSIIRTLPYDRPNTSMASFGMCPECAREYRDPSDRRYHAQPVACPACGPTLRFTGRDGSPRERGVAPNGGSRPSRPDNVLDASAWEDQWAEFIEAGRIVAVKGIGGFHLACDALNPRAVAGLRRRKARGNKPFALMVPDLEWVRTVCELSADEERLLVSRERPVVLLRLKADFETRPDLAPNLNTLGVMLPYTPMHLLMFDRLPRPLVMTSANHTDEPMIHTNRDALRKLAGTADAFLLHDREIINRCDDPVTAVYGGQTVILRPGRGLAPLRFPVPRETAQTVVAAGADMKNTFAAAHGGSIVLSPHIGDLAHPAAQDILRSGIRRYLGSYELRPDKIVCDLHPDYFSVRIAGELAAEYGIPRVAVQHHHAHCLAAAAEFGLQGRAIGVAFDGTGYGTDGTVWGGEILEFDAAGFTRRFHLRPFALPGGEKAVNEPLRTLVSVLSQVERDLRARLCRSEIGIHLHEIETIQQLQQSGLNCPLTSSMGRLFDAAAVLLGACDRPTFDGEAPMRLEALADPEEQGTLPFDIRGDEIDWRPLFREILDRKSAHDTRRLSALFHNTIAAMIFECLRRLDASLPVVFAGGVFQNRFLVERIRRNPAFDPARMFFSSHPNDSAIALGQAWFGIMNKG